MAFVTGLEKEMMIEECRKEVKKISVPGRFRLSAQLIMKNGERRIYIAKTIDHESAVAEVLTFCERQVKCYSFR